MASGSKHRSQAADRTRGAIIRIRTGWLVIAAVATIAALLGVAFWPTPAAVIQNADGGAYRLIGGQRDRLHAGDPLKLKESIYSDERPGDTFVLADGSRVELSERAEIRLETAADGMQLRLQRGRIIVNAAKQRTGHLYVATRDVLVSVVGTVFLVNAEEKGSRVAVIEGEVRVQHGNLEKKLLQGGQVATDPLMKSQPVSEEVAWSRNAEEHLALLEQAAPGAVAPVPMAAFEVTSVRPRSASTGGGSRGGGGGNAPPACGGSPVTLNPGRFVVTNVTLYRLIAMAYGLDCESSEVAETELLSGGPDWLRSDKFDIEATIPQGSPGYTRQELSLGNAPMLQEMIRTLLADRFQLVLRNETKEVSLFLLKTGKSKLQLTPSRESDSSRYVVSTGLNSNGQISTAIGGKKQTLANLARQLALVTRRPVLDRTAIVGEFNYSFEFAPGDDQVGVREMRANGRFPFLTSPSLFTAVEELGLKLETAKDFLEVRVVDHAERPTPN